ncbi:MAG TPA: chemotaxis protein CheW [Ramlibacter sp.]|nr:chemotaxis protein CheW [Ramlibacter sp.]
MANREALRELQSRLASRLQAARSHGMQAAWLAVEAAGQRYLLPLAQAGEIFSYANPQPVPYTRPWFLGVANLRGGLCGVIDLAAYIAGRAPPQRSDAARAESRLVALNAILGVNCAVLIDRLAGLKGLDGFASSSAAPPEAPAWFGSGYTDPQGVYWQEINLQALSQQPQFLSISA